MKSLLSVLTVFIASCHQQDCLVIRKIPCDWVVERNEEGSLSLVSLTVYYAVNYSGKLPAKAIRESVDTILAGIDMSRYDQVTCQFYKESGPLKRIKNCDITDSHNIVSADHKVIGNFTHSGTRSGNQ